MVLVVVLAIAYGIVSYVINNKCSRCKKVGSLIKISSEEVEKVTETKERRFMQSRTAMMREWIHTTYAVFDDVYECEHCGTRMQKKRREVVKKS